MPKSKRNKQIELAKTKKRGLPWKKDLFEKVRSCVDSYTNIFVFSVTDMRNSKMGKVREQWKDSRFFIGKNKIMAMALGRQEEDEYKPNLHKLGQQIKGQCGLLFSNRSTEDVLSWFRSYSEGDYARSGNRATDNVTLDAGPLNFPHSLEPYLRQLGLPTSLVKGVIHLVKEHEVCKEGDILTPETAKILKLLGYEMAEFQISIICVWSQDGSFSQFIENVDTDAKENIKKKKVSSPFKEENVSKIHTPKIQHNSIVITEKGEDTELLIDDSSVKNENVSKPATDEEMEVEMNEESDSDESETENVPCIASPKINEIDTLPVKVLRCDIKNTSTPKEKSKEFIESTPKIQQDSIVITEKGDDTELPIDTPSEAKRKKNKKASEEEDKKIDNKPKSRKRKVNVVAKKESLLKTPDIANSSQESPVFRELRNRSVKVTRKRNK